eukprot:gene15858-biopygen11821
MMTISQLGVLVTRRRAGGAVLPALVAREVVRLREHAGGRPRALQLEAEDVLPDHGAEEAALAPEPARDAPVLINEVESVTKTSQSESQKRSKQSKADQDL